jgi:hypothetical protein
VKDTVKLLAKGEGKGEATDVFILGLEEWASIFWEFPCLTRSFF